MRLYLTLICVFVFALGSFRTQAQNRTVSGRLTSKDGSPLPGVNITIKGTEIGTVTDADGKYSINVPIGSTLVFSFIGMTTKEMVVTGEKMEPGKPGNQKASVNNTKKAGIPPSIYADTVVENTPGVSVFSNKTPKYNDINTSYLNPGSIRSIKKIGKNVIISTYQDVYRQTGIGAQLSTTVGLEEINRLPELQSEYVQGQPVNGVPTARGPESQEIFSWGPSRGTVKTYSPVSFFRKGYSASQELTLIASTKQATYSFDVDHKTRSGVIPNSSYERINIAGGVKDLSILNSLDANAYVAFNQSSGRLLTRGANLATIVGAALRTPISFDNESGLSHAPGVVDNPNALVNELPDHERLRRMFGSLGFVYHKDGSKLKLNVNGSTDNQQSDVVFGMPEGFSGYIKGRLTNRSLDHNNFTAIVSPVLSLNEYSSWQVKLTGSYKMNHSDIQLKRVDAFNLINNRYDSVLNLDRSLSRTYHEVTVFGHLKHYDLFNARLSAMSYFSNTTDVSKYVNLFPSASASVDLARLIYYSYGFGSIKVYANALRTLRETPLIYSNWSYASLNYNPQRYNAFFESGELFFRDGLSPERETKFESGLHVEYYNPNLTLDVVYFNNTTKDFIAPMVLNGAFQLNNVAKVNNYGGSISLNFNSNFYNDFRFSSSLKWSRYNSVSRKVYDNTPVGLAGFSTVQSAIVEGQPVGAIYGSSYQRDPAGNVVTDNDGVPVKDPTLKMIGNPIPDYTLSLYSNFAYQPFSLSFSLEYKKGGDVWNGTRAALDYLGRSGDSGRGRTEGSFDRWTKHGWDGIAENYIEDASWLRLNELTFSYSTPRGKYLGFLQQVKFDLVGRNLFVITPYSGVDPQATLFGYSIASGLDMFNIPSTRSYNFQVTFKI